MRRRGRLLTLLPFLITAAACAWVPSVHAHPMGNFSINHFSNVTVSDHQLRVIYVVDIAEIPTFQDLQSLGVNAPAALSPRARSKYLVARSTALASNIHVRAGSQPVKLRLRGSDVLFPPGAGGLATERIYLVLTAPFQSTGATIQYSDANFPGRAGWKEITVQGGSGVSVHTSLPSGSRSRALTVYPGSVVSSPPQDVSATLTVSHSTTIQATSPLLAPLSLSARAVIRRVEAPLLTAGGGWSLLARGLTRSKTSSNSNNSSAGSGWAGSRSDALSNLIAHGNFSLGMLLVSLLVAFWFGAGHALSPGHGKTVVAAYLVGSKGTARQALLLGLTVTVTHTAGVFALGLVTLYLSGYIVPDQLYPWLGFISGMLVALMGLTLFVRRFRTWYTGRSSSQVEHVHGHDHHHGSHIAPHVHRGFGQAFAALPGAKLQPLAASAHITGSIPHGFNAHSHSHDHHHGSDATPHRHGPFGRAHTHAPIPGQNGERVTLRSLLMLGVSGGLLPCPSALIVLLAAIAFHRVAFGMLLIVAFSLGLATVLTGIGILMVYGGRVMARLQGRGGGSRFVRPVTSLVRVLPIASALLVAGFGTVIALGAIGAKFLPALLISL